MAKYGQTFKDRAVARLLPPQSSSPESVSSEVGVTTATLLRWQADSLRVPAREREPSAAGRLDAVIATTGMDEIHKGAWCREHGLYPIELENWRMSATAALAQPGETRATPQQTRQDRRRIKELEREVNRKNAALAETTALLVLAKKLSVIFPQGADA